MENVEVVWGNWDWVRARVETYKEVRDLYVFSKIMHAKAIRGHFYFIECSVGFSARPC